VRGRAQRIVLSMKGTHVEIIPLQQGLDLRVVLPHDVSEIKQSR